MLSSIHIHLPRKEGLNAHKTTPHQSLIMYVCMYVPQSHAPGASPGAERSTPRRDDQPARSWCCRCSVGSHIRDQSREHRPQLDQIPAVVGGRLLHGYHDALFLFLITYSLPMPYHTTSLLGAGELRLWQHKFFVRGRGLPAVCVLQTCRSRLPCPSTRAAAAWEVGN